ncbi:MAG TPA: hypothetical protein VK815_15645 [Candidatus Acidoferrales bacterium]|jgi:hypothetical protein|nr:hypothetical protein [Candidatus Acidoferrales bacterium]
MQNKSLSYCQPANSSWIAMKIGDGEHLALAYPIQQILEYFDPVACPSLETATSQNHG